MELEILTTETAPDEIKAELGEVQQRYKFVPNLMSAMANAPPVLKAYLNLSGLFDQTSLSPVERRIVIEAADVLTVLGRGNKRRHDKPPQAAEPDADGADAGPESSDLMYLEDSDLGDVAGRPRATRPDINGTEPD